MTLRDEIAPYRDDSGYIAPTPVPPGTKYSSQNLVMFTAEYYIVLMKRGEATLQEAREALRLISACFIEPGLPCRTPESREQDGPDNMLGYLAFAKQFCDPLLAEDILTYGRKHFGWFNQENPGSIYHTGSTRINWSAFLWRMPQLYFAALCAAGQYKWWKIWQLPSMLFTALVILSTGLKNFALSDADARRLTWLLVCATEHDSFLCRQAARVWRWKLYKDYPGEGMRGMAKLWYDPNNPMCKYWVD